MAYQRYEYGTREPAYQKLIALAGYFDVSLNYLVGRNAVTKYSVVQTSKGQYGIRVCKSVDDCIPDISTDAQEFEELAVSLAKGHVLPLHLRDVVGDFLQNYKFRPSY